VRFVNNSGRDLDFDLGGAHYRVAPHAECSIPNVFAYAVKLQGIPLDPTEGEDVEGNVDAAAGQLASLRAEARKALRAMQEQYEKQMSDEADEHAEELDTLNSTLTDLQTEMGELRSERDKLKSDLATANAMIEELTKPKTTPETPNAKSDASDDKSKPKK